MLSSAQPSFPLRGIRGMHIHTAIGFVCRVALVLRSSPHAIAELNVFWTLHHRSALMSIRQVPLHGLLSTMSQFPLSKHGMRKKKRRKALGLWYWRTLKNYTPPLQALSISLGVYISPGGIICFYRTELLSLSLSLRSKFLQKQPISWPKKLTNVSNHIDNLQARSWLILIFQLDFALAVFSSASSYG